MLLCIPLIIATGALAASIHHRDAVVLDSLPDGVAGGILPGWDNLPKASDLQDKVGLNDTAVQQLPLQVLNIPCVGLVSIA